MSWLVRFDLVKNANGTNAILCSYNIAALVSAPWRQNDFIEACALIRTSDDFFPCPWIDLISRVGIFAKQIKNLEPRNGDCLYEQPFRRRSIEFEYSFQ